MSKLFGMVAAAALFASVTAFAQNSPPSSSSDTASAPAAAPADDSAKPEKPMHKHSHHHMAGGNGGTDENADKLNACMSNATPTSQQESCLKQAAGTGNG
jgi:Spy/CpxP family protein refolding chaperone